MTEAMKVVDELNDWINDTENASETPYASLDYTSTTESISIGDMMIWNDQDVDEDWPLVQNVAEQDYDSVPLSRDACLQCWMNKLDRLKPFQDKWQQRDK